MARSVPDITLPGMSNGKEPLIPPGPETPGFQRLYRIVSQLRSPQGCPWDREQTPESLRAGLIEEAYEAVEAINHRDLPHIREELGDVMLMAVMIGQIYEDQGDFTVQQILHEVSEKLIRRHPHVFSHAQADHPDEVVRQWDQIKETVEGRRKKDSILDSVSQALPPLERAYKLQKKAAKAGFDWTEAEPVWDKIQEELEETREAWKNRQLSPAPQSPSGTASPSAGSSPEEQTKNQDHLEEELGDLLFSVVNVARFLHIDPAIALHRANAKFSRRFRGVEQEMKAQGVPMGPQEFQRMDRLWDQVKQNED